MTIITSCSQLPDGYNFIIHKYNTNLTSCNGKPIIMVLSFKYVGIDRNDRF